MGGTAVLRLEETRKLEALRWYLVVWMRFYLSSRGMLLDGILL